MNERKKILVVDDEPGNLALMREILKEDYELTFAKNGDDALANLIRSKPDLVLLDVLMPRRDGYSVRQAMLDDPRISDIPVIFCTAMSDSADEVKGLELGAVDYITKPVRPAVVRMRVRNHLALADQNYAMQQKVKEAHADLLKTRLKTLQMLGRAAEYKDNETGLHVIRMSHYAKLLAQAAGWNDASTELLFNAAPMHDIGKIGIPDAILTKPGPFDEAERLVMNRHPEIGAEIIGGFTEQSDLFEMAHTIALSHHEKWDGTGYPKGLKGEGIPASGRIVAIADVFDALTSQRPYKKAWTVERAVALLHEQAGKHFDPELVDLFTEQMPAIEAIRLRWGERVAE